MIYVDNGIRLERTEEKNSIIILYLYYKNYIIKKLKEELQISWIAN